MIDLLFINGRQQGSISIMWSASLRTEIKLVSGFYWFKNTIIHPIPLQYTDTQSQIHTHTWLLVLTRIVECRFLSSQRKLDTNTHTHNIQWLLFPSSTTILMSTSFTVVLAETRFYSTITYWNHFKSLSTIYVHTILYLSRMEGHVT